MSPVMGKVEGRWGSGFRNRLLLRRKGGLVFSKKKRKKGAEDFSKKSGVGGKSHLGKGESSIRWCMWSMAWGKGGEKGGQGQRREGGNNLYVPLDRIYPEGEGKGANRSRKGDRLKGGEERDARHVRYAARRACGERRTELGGRKGRVRHGKARNIFSKKGGKKRYPRERGRGSVSVNSKEGKRGGASTRRKSIHFSISPQGKARLLAVKAPPIR